MMLETAVVAIGTEWRALALTQVHHPDGSRQRRGGEHLTVQNANQVATASAGWTARSIQWTWTVQALQHEEVARKGMEWRVQQ